jgi:hypothetical protein
LWLAKRTRGGSFCIRVTANEQRESTGNGIYCRIVNPNATRSHRRVDSIQLGADGRITNDLGRDVGRAATANAVRVRAQREYGLGHVNSKVREKRRPGRWSPGMYFVRPQYDEVAALPQVIAASKPEYAGAAESNADREILMCVFRKGLSLIGRSHQLDSDVRRELEARHLGSIATEVETVV